MTVENIHTRETENKKCWTVLGGWAFPPSILSGIFGEKATYIDLNLIMPDLIAGNTLKQDWIEQIRSLVLTEKPPSLLAGWSTGAIVALALAPHLKIDTLVLLSATPSFCRREGFRFGARPSVVQSMIEALSVSPQAVLQRFYEQCGFSGTPHAHTYSYQQLVSGLQFLEQVNLLPVQKLDCMVQVFHGREDKIIPVEAGRQVCATLEGVMVEYPGSHLFFLEHDKIRDRIHSGGCHNISIEPHRF